MKKILLLLLSSIVPVFGQANQGELQLKVIDPAGVPVKASVHIVSEANQYSNALATADDGRLVVMNCASPMTSRQTRLFCPIARNFDKHIPVEAVHEFNRRVFEEDRRVVEAQKPEYLPLDPTLEAHISADRSSFAYRKGLLAMGFSPIFAA